MISSGANKKYMIFLVTGHNLRGIEVAPALAIDKFWDKSVLRSRIIFHAGAAALTRIKMYKYLNFAPPAVGKRAAAGADSFSCSGAGAASKMVRLRNNVINFLFSVTDLFQYAFI
jgi:hypothetical protein